jgi:hypothetical protein
MGDNEIRAVEIRAELRQIKTMADGSMNIVFNLPEDCREQVKVMMDWHHLEIFGLLSLEQLNTLRNGE